MARYVIGKTWRTVNSHEHTDYDGNKYHVVREYTSITDTLGHHTYHDGAYRVRIVAWHGDDRPRTKTFKGETAWSDSERLYGDLVHRIDVTRWG